MRFALATALWAIAVLPLAVAQPVFAQQSLDELMRKVKELSRPVGSGQAPAANLGDPEALLQRLDETRKALAAAQLRSDELTRQFGDGQRALEKVNESLANQTADTADLFAVLRQNAIDTVAVLKSSLVSAQSGLRTDLPEQLAQTGHIPSPDELTAFHELLFEEIVQTGRVARFRSEIVDAAGKPEMTDVLRVGMFNLIAGDRFLRFEADNGTLQELPRQPARRFRRDAQKLFAAGDEVVAMAIDPTGGQLLGLLIQSPGLRERVDQGGPVGYIIIFLGLAGLGLGFYRLGYLGIAGSRVDRQLKSDTVLEDNALGRILSVYFRNPMVSTEVLELKLDEAIISETPDLEKWQVALKVIAAVTPLLGLLGTVVGMIETFQQITLYGTTDARLMADGISKALVTTMLGLVAAIPIVLIHSMVASRSKRLIEILEEQSAAIIATQAEKKQ